MHKSIWIGDLEANGLLEEATKVHCGVFKNREGENTKFNPSEIKLMLDFLDKVDILVIHNGLGYDLPLLEKLYGWKYNGIVLDTLVLSRLLQPERVGRHGLEVWGERFGVPKPVHEDWSVYTPAMLHRCEQDVEINRLTLEALMKESELTVEDLCKLPKN